MTTYQNCKMGSRRAQLFQTTDTLEISLSQAFTGSVKSRK
jgi:hypothetical protein